MQCVVYKSDTASSRLVFILSIFKIKNIHWCFAHSPSVSVEVCDMDGEDRSPVWEAELLVLVHTIGLEDRDADGGVQKQRYRD